MLRIELIRRTRCGIDGHVQLFNQAAIPRACPAIVLAAWLHLLAAPALAMAPAMAGGMDHCDHAGDCPQMQSLDCATGTDALAGHERSPGTARLPALLLLLPPDAPGASASLHRAQTRRPPATGPPITLRFGHLRN